MSGGTWMARDEDDRSVTGLPRIGQRVRLTVGRDDHNDAAPVELVGSIVGYSVVHRANAADWRDGLGQLVALVDLDGPGRYLEGVRVTTSLLPCDLSAIELEPSETCQCCGLVISDETDPTGLRVRAWREHSWGDDRDFQCGIADDGRHRP